MTCRHNRRLLNFRRLFAVKKLIAFLFLSSMAFAASADIRGAGATFPSAVYKAWAVAYGKEHGVNVDYQATGSGDGLRRIIGREVAFGASDSPMPPEELARHRLVQLPTAVGGIVPVVNLRGMAANELRLTGELLADIMSGKVARWNNARIAALNPGKALPSVPIVRVVRADKSGTTDAFTKYLSLVSANWKGTVGQGQAVKWPGSVLAVEGNDGIAKAMKETAGAIGYVSFDRVARNGLVPASLRNASGVFVAASESGFRAAVQASDLAKKDDETASLLQREGPLVWPMTITTYLLVDANPPTAAGAEQTLQFLYWTFLKGDTVIRTSGFTPLPAAVQARFVSRFRSVKPQDGQPLNFYSM
jgi:phosphate transport system substrate-binding protein